MSYGSLAIDQDHQTAEQALFVGELNVIWARPDAFPFDRSAFSEPFGQTPASRSWAETGQSLGLRSRIDLAGRVRLTVTDTLSQGVPTLSAIASELGIGPRTLQRRLSASGHSFQGIVDMARKDLAQRLLQETELCLAEIAFLTGFSEQSGFTRAFKRWAGQTPRSYRLETSSARQSGPDSIGSYSGVSEQQNAAHYCNQLT